MFTVAASMGRVIYVKGRGILQNVRALLSKRSKSLVPTQAKYIPTGNQL
jgi:hypothetical protein